MRSDEDIEKAMHDHGDAIWRVCLLRMGSRSDAQDMFQETFLSYATHDGVLFENEEHRRAWLITVATNRCRDLIRLKSRCEDESAFDPNAAAALELAGQPDAALWEVSDALNKLPADQREALYLTICEGYPAAEAARIMNAPVNTLYSWVKRGKARLKEALS